MGSTRFIPAAASSPRNVAASRISIMPMTAVSTIIKVPLKSIEMYFDVMNVLFFFFISIPLSGTLIVSIPFFRMDRV
jgi:hypothetical protein